MQDISRQIGIAIRWLPLIVVGALLAGFLAFTMTSGQPKVYESTARLRVDPGPDPSVSDWAVAESALNLYSELATSIPVAEDVIETLGLNESPRGLQGRLMTDTTARSLELAIMARASDAEAARELASAVALELRLRVRDQLVTEDVKAANSAIREVERLMQTLERRLEQLLAKNNKTQLDRGEIISLTSELAALRREVQDLRRDSRSSVRNLLEWFERPRAPLAEVEPRPLYWTVLALAAGAMLAAGLAFVLEYLRTHNKIRDERDLEDATGLLPLGSVVEDRRDSRSEAPARLVMLRYPRSEAAEMYRGLLARIGFANGSARTLMVASASDTDAKSAVAANVALAYAEAGRNVILVDADYRSPRLHAFFGVKNDRGLTTVLADPKVPLGWVTVATSHPRLGLMPAGAMPPEASDPLGSQQVTTLLRRLLHAADMVVFDSPSMSGSLDAAVLAAHLNESVLVVPEGSKEDETAEAARILLGSESDVAGAVLYRKARRLRKGTRKAVVPPPAGQDPPQPPSPPRRIPVAVTPGGASAASAHPSQVAAPPGPSGQAPTGQASNPGPNGPSPIANGPVAGQVGATPTSPPPAGPYTDPFEPGKAPAGR